MKTWQKIRQNLSLRSQFLVREQVIDAIREFLKSNNFHEVETPLLVKNPGTEPYLEVFETRLKTLDHPDQTGFLLTSPEFALKKLLAAGMGNIFEICKSFRNGEGISSSHNHEFTMLEFYRVNADYRDIMADCEQLLLFILQKIKKTQEEVLEYQGNTYQLATPWERISVAEAFEKYASVDVETLLSAEKLLAVAVEKGYAISNSSTWEEAYNQIFLNEIEPELGQTGPTFLYDYPVAQAALSKRKADDPRFAERFELYLAGLELGNAFSELTDATEQQQRMESDLAEREALGKTKYDLDHDFIAALESGMPQTGGIAIGVDRLVMLFADVPSIKDTLFFPIDEVFEFQ